MQGLIKIIIGVWIGIFLFGGGVFAVTSNYTAIDESKQEKIYNNSSEAARQKVMKQFNISATELYWNLSDGKNGPITKALIKANSETDSNGNAGDSNSNGNNKDNISNYQKIQDKISENVDIMENADHYTDEGSKTVYDLTVENNKLSEEAKSLKDDNGNIYSTKKEADAANKDIKDTNEMLRTDENGKVWGTEVEAEKSDLDIKTLKTLTDYQKTDEYKNLSAKDKKAINDKIEGLGGSRSECRSQNGLSTSIAYNKNDQSPFCFSEKGKNGYSCVSGPCKNGSGTTLRVYNKGIADKKGLDLIQYFLSTILGFSLKFGAMLAVLAIILGGIQVSASMENDSGSIGKEKIIGGIAALLVLFFAGVILNFINPNYFVW